MTRFPEHELLEYAEADCVKERAAILRQAVEAQNELRERCLIAEKDRDQYANNLKQLRRKFMAHDDSPVAGGTPAETESGDWAPADLCDS